MDGDEDAGNNSSTDGETVVEGTCVDGADVEIPVIVTWLTEVSANSTLGKALDFFMDGPDDIPSDAGSFRLDVSLSLVFSFSSFSSLADPRRTLTRARLFGRAAAAETRELFPPTIVKK